MQQQQKFNELVDLPPEIAVERLLGIAASDLRATAMQCFRMAASAGPLQPKGSSGTLAWIYGIEAFRTQMIPKGWTPSDPSNQPRIVSPDSKHAVTVVCGDLNTGNPHGKPLTRNKRGNRTTRSVHYKVSQGELFPVERNIRQDFLSDSPTEQILWIFLFYVDVENRVVRYELSRPINMGQNDKVDGWEPRFIMPPLSIDAPDNDFDQPDAGPDINIPVTPRS